ncbi:MAG: multicopper oxidase domain-containing protein [Calditrichia bacterium]
MQSGVLRVLLPMLIMTLLLSAQTSFKTLWIPPTLSGPEYNLTMQNGSMEFIDGLQTPTSGYNGNYLGPTLIFRKGEMATFNLTNLIGDTTTNHWHGMHVPAIYDGGPHTRIFPGETWSPFFRIMNDASTMWYHPHLHRITEAHVHSGLAGMIIIQDTVESTFKLPRDYGVDDIPIFLQDRTILPNGEFQFDPTVISAGEMGDRLVINGVLNPLHQTPAQQVRFRLLNASSARVYNIGISDNRSFHQIASDGGLLEEPVSVTRVPLSSGERAEIVVDFTSDMGDTLYLMTYASELVRNEPGGANSSGSGNPLDGADTTVVALVIVAPTAADNQLPTEFTEIDELRESDADTTRDFFLLSSNLSINGQKFNHNVINERVRLGNVEIWTVGNPGDMPHPFHIHDVQFFILDRNGMPPKPTERGKKDTVLLYGGDLLRLIMVFEDYSDSQTTYMYHCHFLRHEDMGMMAQFVIYDSVLTGIEGPTAPSTNLLLSNYPNPFNPETKIRFVLKEPGRTLLEVYNLLGERVAVLADGFRFSGDHVLTWNPANAASGIYIARLQSGGAVKTQKMILMR